MTDTEEQLRRALQEQPPQPEPGELLSAVRTKIRKRRTARVTAATAVAGAVVVGGAAVLATSTFAGSGRSPSAGGQPGSKGAATWVNQPTTAPTTAGSSQPHPQWRPCRAGDLKVDASNPTPGAGRITVTVSLTNQSTTGCRLPQQPTKLTGLGADGTSRRVTAGYQTAAQYGLQTPPDIAPGRHAVFDMTIPMHCSKPGSGAAEAFHSFRFDMPGHGKDTFSLPGGSALLVGCGVSVSGFGLPPHEAPEARSPLDGLRAASSMRQHVAAGSTVRFTVTLTNTSNHTVSLRPCPAYSEFLSHLGSSPASTRKTYLLNCAASPTIAAHRSQAFRMRVQVPTQPGKAKFGWSIPGSSVETGRLVTISRP